MLAIYAGAKRHVSRTEASSRHRIRIGIADTGTVDLPFAAAICLL